MATDSQSQFEIAMGLNATDVPNVRQAVPFFNVKDIEASLRFYVDGLGFTISRRWDREGRIRWCWLELGRASIMLQQYWKDGQPGGWPEGPLGRGLSICFMCADAIAVYHEARARGLEASRPFVGNSLWVTSLVDPDGYRLDFESPTDVPEETVLASGMKILDTPRLTLRELTEGDASFMLELLNEPSFLRFVGDRGVRTVTEARSYLLKGPMSSYARFGFGLYLVELRDEKTPIGICGLVKREALEDVDIGFALLPGFWSRGYALESAAAVMNYGREVIGLTRIVAIVSPDNVRSIGLLGKLGMGFERRITSPESGSELELYAVGV